MTILVTNDDGIFAPGINVLTDYLEKNNHRVIVVAPDMEKSASSHSITLQTPLRIIPKGNNRYAITGSPVDCVIMAMKAIVKEKIDLAISGINCGHNMGEDILYSGTVAAAIEAMYFGLPALAVSLRTHHGDHFDTAAQFVCRFIEEGIHKQIAADEIFNINVPAIPLAEVKGVKLTKTGHRRYSGFVHETEDPKGRKVYWLGGNRPEWKIEEGTDIEAVDNDFISITPIAPKFTHYQSFPKVEKWLSGREK